ncbi:hypothetical protein ACI75Y_04135 [Capnocytophaga stomatis]
MNEHPANYTNTHGLFITFYVQTCENLWYLRAVKSGKICQNKHLK